MTTGIPDPYRPQQRSGPRPSPGAGATQPGRRSRARVIVPLAVATWAVLELWLLTVVADAWGGLAVLGLLLGGLVLGGLVIKWAGRRAWRGLMEGLQPDASPPPDAAGARARSDSRAGGGRSGGGNALAMLGGLLLMFPGLLSDAAGLLCLFPPTAALLRRSAERLVTRGSGFGPGSLGHAVHQMRTAQDLGRIHRPDGKVVQGEVIRDEDEPPAEPPAR